MCLACVNGQVSIFFTSARHAFKPASCIWQVKWVAYRDYELQKSHVLEVSPWTEDPASLVGFYLHVYDAICNL